MIPRLAAAALLATLTLPALAAPPTDVVVDGQVDEWSDANQAVLLGDDLVLRLSSSREVSLHAAPRPLIISLDLDQDDATGDAGVDARITFAPENSRDGVRIDTIGPSGFTSPRTTLDADLVISPSFAARDFEIRLDPRHLAQLAGVPYTGQVEVAVEGNAGFDDATFTVTAAPAADATAAAPETPAEIPAKPAGGLRIASFNVERAAPTTDPERFGKLMTALDADLYLLQEWNDATPDQLRAWFTRNVDRGPWQAATGPMGVAIVSRLPLQDAAAPLDDTRLVVAVADTPLGPVTVASMHLKCCGSPGSSEDNRRIDQARNIAATLQRIAPARRRQMVISGDLNLVGTDRPLLQLIRSGDADRSDLLPVDTPVLGDRARYTWRQPAQPYALGRLDYLMITDATLTPVHGFALDTLRLDPLPAGLDRATSSASDHLPIVVDLLPR